jgi:DNA repair photolyase
MDMKKDFASQRKGFGVQEWAEYRMNFQTGCRHGCVYCYAREQAIRFKWISTWEEWETPKIRENALKKKFGKRQGVTMMPTTHDITPENWKTFKTILIRLLTPGNNVLLVTKPHLSCMRELANCFGPYRENLLIRITLGTTDDTIREVLEPNAPSVGERLEALRWLFEERFRTSVSCEPLLGDSATFKAIVEAVKAYVTDDVWVGFMNNPTRRIRKDLLKDETVKQVLSHITPDKIKDTIEGILLLRAEYDALHNPSVTIRLKESITRQLPL